MTEKQARPSVEAWLETMRDRLWLGQFRMHIVYVDDKDDDLFVEGKGGECIVDHAYGEITIRLFLPNVEDEDDLFRILLHEVCHGVAAEFWHVEHDILPPILERESERVRQIVKRTFTYAHERFVQRMTSIVLEQNPYPEGWPAVQASEQEEAA